MQATFTTYLMLGGAILAEVIGSSFLQRSAQFTKLGPSLCTGAFYILSFYMLSQVLRSMSLGVAYAIWSGLGMVLTAAVSVLVFRQGLDLPAVLGIALILAGVLVMNLFSATGH